MSKHHKETITCPQCGKDDEFLIWDSINTVIDPEMKEKVRTGEAFRWVCPHCGNTATVNYTTLYHQMEDHVMIYLVHGDKTEAIHALQGLFHDKDGNLVESIIRPDEDYRNRVVGSMNEFREKIMILDAGLDDHVIELMKLFMISHLQQNDKDLQIEEFLFDGRPDGIASFAVNTGDKGWGSVAFDKGFYDHVAENFKVAIEADREVVVDQKWAFDLLSKQK